VVPSVNYYVQQLFGHNQGDTYHAGVVTPPAGAVSDTTVAASCVRDSKAGDVVLQLVNASGSAQPFQVDLSRFKRLRPVAARTIFTGPKDAKNTLESPQTVLSKAASYKAGKRFSYEAQPYSLTVIRLRGKG